MVMPLHPDVVGGRGGQHKICGRKVILIYITCRGLRDFGVHYETGVQTGG